MDAKQLIDAHRAALKDAEAAGLTAIQTSMLHSIFNEFEAKLTSEQKDIHPLELEKFRSDLAGSQAYQEHVRTWSLEGFKQVIALGQSTLKSMMLINGGAAVALLAFLGNLLSKENTPAKNIIPFAGSMRMFVLGVFLAAVAYATTYFSQLHYSGDKKWHQQAGLGFHILTSIIGTCSLAAFLYGSNLAYQAFVTFAP